MSQPPSDPEIRRASEIDQELLSMSLREGVDIEPSAEVFVYRDDDGVVIEPIPSLSELHGIHAGNHEPGEVLQQLRDMDDDFE